METDPSCTFCKIITENVYSIKVFETKHSLAFLDINPANPGHTLVIPKKHFETIYEIEGDYLQDLISVTQEISKAIKHTFGSRGLDLIQKNGKVGGQQVDHFHMQVVPRDYGDGVQINLNGKSATENELEDYSKRLREHLKIEEEYEQKDKIEVALENIDDSIEHLEAMFHENKKLTKKDDNYVEEKTKENASRS